MIYFEKYHGTGNDFILLNGIDNDYKFPKKLSQSLCDRHFGVGADGIMIVTKSTVADVKMAFYNADGSLAPMCGNGIRCFTKYVHDHEIVDKQEFTVETLAGILPVSLTSGINGIDYVKVNLGIPCFDIESMDVDSHESRLINQLMEVEGQEFYYSILTMGTLHCVIFIENSDCLDVTYYGKLIESHPLFPNKINVNFVKIVDANHIEVKTYERGAGFTLSCGTGSAASAVIATHLWGLQRDIHVEVMGGNLLIEQESGDVYLNGPAEFVCKGYFNLNKGEHNEEC